MSIFGAVVAGIAGTLVITMVMAMAPKMGMPKMDMVGMLGSMFNPDGNRGLGWTVHSMMGIVFAILYAIGWSALGAVGIGTGAIFGVVHWLIAGTMMGMMGVMHAGIKAGTVQEPGILMFNNGGMMGFMGGLVGHAIFGVVVALVYAAFV